MDLNANINTAQCMVKKAHLGYDTFVNVCTGLHTDVDWTGLEWFAKGLAFGIIFILIAVIVIAICGLCGVFER